MSRIPPIIPISDLRQDAASVIQKLKGSKEPLVITQRGRAAAIMLSIEEYEKAQKDRQILQLLAQGEQEIAAGVGHDLEEVLADARKALDQVS